MGKVSNKAAVEIIPINKVNSNNKPQSSYNHSNIKMHRTPYMSDPALVPRVKKYLESNVDKTYVDINVMADDLQRNFREYAKRKRSAFRASVKKAYSIVLQSYGLEEQGSSEEDESDEASDSEHSMHPQLVNSYPQLVDLYPSLPQRQMIDENELIDISSDDSEVETENARISNGPSTSQNKSHILPPGGKEPNYERSKKRKADANFSKSSSSKKKKSMPNNPESRITFKNVGGLDKTLEDICKLVVHIQHPELYKQIGISPPRGFLLHGPPGCGKTLLANAIAGELNIPLIKVAAPELVTGISGESEERIRELFERALNSSPCVLFIDEIDAITPNRQNAQKEMERRIVAQLLSCLDDLSSNENGERVLVIGATNRPDSIDPALRRAGRFDREICLGIPNVQSRAQILKMLTSRMKLEESFDFEAIAKFTPGFVGADLLSLAREAAMVAVNKKINEIQERRRMEEEAAREAALQKVLDEKRKRAEELERQQQLEQQRKEEEEKVREKEASVAPEANKSDPEIIVDDEAAKEAQTEQVNGTIANKADDAVVIIDDDSSKHVADQVQNGAIEKSEVEPMPVDVGTKVPTLKELLWSELSWLHQKRPISDEELHSMFITMDDFGSALKCVQPSAKREGFATVPDITWDDVGSLREIREELQMTILAPVRYSQQFKDLGLTVPTGVLLCGPPGCGKTLLAKAIANEAGINFISVKGPELLNMYVGESERAVRVCFERARNSAPCVIFFDELDALCPKRSDSRENGATMRVVNQMLTEMDGVEGRQGVFLLAASNRPDIIDPAVLRPGRLDKIIFVDLPSASDRVDILRTITKNGTRPQLAPDVDLEVIGKSEQCRGYTGADLAALVREAAVIALKEVMMCGEGQVVRVTTEHFNQAVNKIRPSVTEKDQKHYEKLKRLYTAVPENSEVEEMEYS